MSKRGIIHGFAEAATLVCAFGLMMVGGAVFAAPPNPNIPLWPILGLPVGLAMNFFDESIADCMTNIIMGGSEAPTAPGRPKRSISYAGGKRHGYHPEGH